MTAAAIGPLAIETERARALVLTLSDDEWAAPSGCAGWRVQDVVAHMACVFHQVADPASIESGTSDDVEVNAEVPVQARRGLSPTEVAAEYDTWSVAGLGAMRALQEPGLGDTVVPLGNLGAHPLHLLANALVFDHYCHLRHDIGVAVPRAAELPRDADTMVAVLEWMMAGVPQMCSSALAGATEGVNLVLTGPGGGTWALAPQEPLWTVEPGADASLPTAIGSAHDFVSWGTKRSDWRGVVELSDPVAAPTLDAINVI